ncbi:hypothetical protein L227DRAFT_651068 [Lentinus tigrinus ALCF2SS1-6]|uniref:F-box domain-containing protein n=1 Tax=Lentinus tigrinus ALCF2SS1-6 TaxID=1328759 RepID=A0A5C2SHX5_9APHY|nr:hypothetical protein L227DRAFT_651068 [Lentinus tigrinus ALCF2SS1-6]
MANQSISDVHDIVLEIFSYFNPEHYDNQADIASARNTLLHSALTCKNWTRPALNILWSCLPSDQPLLQLLAALGITLEITTHSKTPDRVYIYPGPSPEDQRTHPHWSYFQLYASRVHTITICPFSRQPSVWTNIMPKLHGDPVLPRLQNVVLRSSLWSSGPGLEDIPVRRSRDNLGRGVLQLISPSVRRLSLLIPVRGIGGGLLQEVFDEACTLTHQLEHVHIYSLSSLNLGTLRSQKHVRAAHIDVFPDVSAHGLEPLSNLPHLELLSVAVTIATPVDLTFNHVRVLVLEGLWIPMRAFLDNACLPDLRSLSVHAAHLDSVRLAPQCTILFRVISNKYANLTELHIRCHKPTSTPDPIQFHARLATIEDPRTLAGTLWALIEPLLSLHELRDVSLRFDVFSFAYSSSDIRSFAESWPHLETFRLEFVTVEQQRASFTSLVHFACNCPRLRTLHLPEMELAQDALDGFTYLNRPHPLRDLNVARVGFPRGIDLSWEMIQFAQTVFPHADCPVSV